MTKQFRSILLISSLLVATGIAYSQSTSQAQSAPSSSTSSVEQSAPAPSSAQATPSPSRAVENADEEVENSQFKYSPAVKAVASKTGLSKAAVYWIFLLINFAILAGAIVWIVKKLMPNGFQPRTAEIQKGIEEARKASAEATARLKEIEGRLAKLDSEIAEIRATAEADFSGEEERIKAAAEQDAKNVVAAAEQEIAAAQRTAQRELKAFVAGLAVDLAEKKIKVDEATDRVLVEGFASQLGKDGQ